MESFKFSPSGHTDLCKLKIIDGSGSPCSETVSEHQNPGLQPSQGACPALVPLGKKDACGTKMNFPFLSEGAGGVVVVPSDPEGLWLSDTSSDLPCNEWGPLSCRLLCLVALQPCSCLCCFSVPVAAAFVWKQSNKTLHEHKVLPELLRERFTGCPSAAARGFALFSVISSAGKGSCTPNPKLSHCMM